MRNDNERVRLEMEILKYRNFHLFIEGKKFRQTAKEKIAELENNLSAIEEIGRLALVRGAQQKTSTSPGPDGLRLRDCARMSRQGPVVPQQ